MKKEKIGKWNKYYKEIFRFTNKKSLSCKDRNYSYFISDENVDKIAITYNIVNKNAFWGLHSSIGENDIVEWMLGMDSPFQNKEKMNKKVDELKKIISGILIFSCQMQIKIKKH